MVRHPHHGARDGRPGVRIRGALSSVFVSEIPPASPPLPCPPSFHLLHLLPVVDSENRSTFPLSGGEEEAGQRRSSLRLLSKGRQLPSRAFGRDAERQAGQWDRVMVGRGVLSCTLIGCSHR